MTKETQRKNITQPADHWAAFQEAANKSGMSLSQWIGEAAKAKLTISAVSKLSERAAAHRPRRVEKGVLND